MAMGLHGGGARRRRGRSQRAPMAEINVTPLVDVMLVLLIIFMVTAPLLKAGVPVELPESRAKALGEEKQQVTITMARDGAIYLDDAPLSPGELPDRLAALPRDGEGKPPLVTLRADKALDYGSVMGVMGELNRAGFNAISLVTSVGAAPPVVTGRSGAGQ
ncbi:MAG: biopolymer transporter ExbD [Sphingomonadales bacterium]|nr:biopolymer transporter ExbD [Sphingomonadales bacterium]